MPDEPVQPEQPEQQSITVEELRQVILRGLRRAPIPYEADANDVLTLAACTKALDLLCAAANLAATQPADEPPGNGSSPPGPAKPPSPARAKPGGTKAK